MSLRAGFLIVVAAVVLHVSFGLMFAILVGYAICAEIDKWLVNKERNKAKQKVVDEEVDWKEDPERPEWENKGAFTRRKLLENEQIIVTRVAMLLSRMP